MTTMVMVSFGPTGCEGSGGGGSKLFLSLCWAISCASPGCRGRKLEATTAFGIADTARGFSEARRVVFSLLRSDQCRPQLI